MPSQQLGVATHQSMIRFDHAATPRAAGQPDPGESVVVMELDELWHFLQKKRTSLWFGWLLIALGQRLVDWECGGRDATPGTLEPVLL